MSESFYVASKSRSQGRPGWSISFRHPLRTDSKGRQGLKMRRGLGTDNAEEADLLVEQMNSILSDPSWWNAAKRPEAERKFRKVVTDAFFDAIQAGQPNPRSLRERACPMPGTKEGYSKALLLGPTGVGKTSLLRQLIGSDPTSDRFPSTSTAKTTVSDIEVIQSPGPHLGIVTFLSEFQVQTNIEECVLDACIAASEEASDQQIADRLLNHRDQCFRLSYTLGSWRLPLDLTEEDEWNFDSHHAESENISDGERVPESEKQKNQETLESFVLRIRLLAKKAKDTLSQEPRDVESADTNDDSVLELFEKCVQDECDFGELVLDILSEVRNRFDCLEDLGDLDRSSSGWPRLWSFEHDNRDEFIRQIRRFSSNYAPQFGRLLTPLVEGIRIKGPFYPHFASTAPKLVLLDGRGLGHTPDSTSSLTTQLTERFREVDVILLVDSAQQPMQAASLAVLRAVTSSGHHEKLCIAFTHFDLVEGPNLPGFYEKKSHVMASVTNALTALKNIVGPAGIRALERDLSSRCFMLGGLDKPIKKIPRGVISELGKLLSFFADAIELPKVSQARPTYDLSGLLFAVQSAAEDFMRPWLARLGFDTDGEIHKEHWTRIKALSRRFAFELALEYDSLRPVADLLARLQEAVSRFLENPAGWTKRGRNDKEEEVAVAQIQRAVFEQLHTLILGRLVVKRLAQWRTAYDFSGRGSAYERALVIRNLFDKAAPIPSAALNPGAAAFLKEVGDIVTDAVKEHGGQLDFLNQTTSKRLHLIENADNSMR